KRRFADPRLHIELDLLDAGIAINLGRSAEAFRLATTTAVDMCSDRLRLRRLPGLVSTLAGLGHTADAIDAGERELAEMDRLAARYPYLLGTATVALVEACLLHGALDRADELIADGYRDREPRGADGLCGHWALVR